MFFSAKWIGSGCALIILAGACGCETGAKPADSNVNFAPSAAVAAKPGAEAVNEMPAPPKDAQYTICCRDFSEPTHVQDARDAQSVLQQTTSMKKWYVVHAADHSTLYYGFYRTIDPRDPKDGSEGQRALDDLKTIRQMQSSDGNRLFPASLPVAIDAPDPQANPAWDITRTTGTWSIEIASYSNTADRKQNAVDSVRAARERGVEAYYYHGPTVSSVCIGCWPAEAAVEVDTDVQNTDPDKPLYVTPRPLDPQADDKVTKLGLKTVAPHVDIVDPTLLQALSKWTEHAFNGQTRVQTDPVTGQPTKLVEKSFLFKIPHRDPLDSLTPTDTAVVAPPPARNPDQASPGAGQLRSLGD